MQEESKFGDFEDLESEEPEQTISLRVRTPNKGELIGVVIERLGGNRMNVHSTDGKIRNCRVPGRYKRRLWLRPKDVVIIVPWEDNDDKADIIYKYPPAAANQLRKNGILDSIKSDF